MIDAIQTYTIFPLGDAAATIDFGNLINDEIHHKVIAAFKQLQQKPLPGMIEAIPAYSSLTVYYDVLKVKKSSSEKSTAFETVKNFLEEMLQQPFSQSIITERLVKIPVCYETAFAPDLENIAAIKNCTMDELIQIHSATIYKVYMLGFLPGFPYMGIVNEKIAIARKLQPVDVVAGSVGIAGRQTGIYPVASPGGWQIIGQTPLKIFDAKRDEPALLNAGDSVQFYSISKEEFLKIKG
jgi:inhibitor of KinA